jgi:adenosylcobinamide kinase / adenosylcobinamide-phosphate guanylyltransferase
MLARSLASSGLFFVATGEPLDDEMAERIAAHKARRPAAFTTVEEPRNLTGALDSLAGRAGLVVIDCLTLWISNLMTAGEDGAAIVAKARDLATALSRAPFPSVVVTDEVGAGIVPENPEARRFRDLLGWTNQEIARAAEKVILMVAGYPLRVK